MFSANSGDADQTPRFAASDLGLHCLPVTHKYKRTLWLYGISSGSTANVPTKRTTEYDNSNNAN